MKQLRFRALDRGYTEMYYSTDYAWLADFFSATSPGELSGEGIYPEGNTFIMRCADENDKTGKLIYEDDIVLVEYSNQIGGRNLKFDFVKCIVKYYPDRGFVTEPIKKPKYKYYCGDLDDCEIIGNIHQNPELLTD